LEAETPRTSAISALFSPAWNFRAMSSRSRGSRVASASLGCLRLAFGRGLVGRRLVGELRAALAPAQLVERGVACDPEEPRPLGPAARIERALLAKGALERAGGDLLRRRAIAQQRGRIREDGVRAGSVERLERGADVRGRLVYGHRQGVLHIGCYGAGADSSQAHRNPREAEGIVTV
jgi:hypothetical protein